MGDVSAFNIPSLKCYFGSEDHYPQHFEVLKRGHWVIRVFFIRTSNRNGLVFEYKHHWCGRVLLPSEADELFRQTMRHKRRLRREWNQKVRAMREENH
jgi:hypothetical protein